MNVSGYSDKQDQGYLVLFPVWVAMMDGRHSDLMVALSFLLIPGSIIAIPNFLDSLTMDKTLLEILACPICKGELLYDQQNAEIICRFDQLAFPVINDIPVMLQSRARRLGHEEEGA